MEDLAYECLRVGLEQLGLLGPPAEYELVHRWADQLDFRRYQPFSGDKYDEDVDRKFFRRSSSDASCKTEQKGERSGSVASDYTVCLFASIMIRRQRVLPGSIYIILSSDESTFVLTHRGTV